MRYYSAKIQKDLHFILNKGFCCHTHLRAVKKYNEISGQLLETDKLVLFSLLLDIDPYNPDGSDGAYYELGTYTKAMIGRKTPQDEMPHVYITDAMVSYAKKNNYLLPEHKIDKNKDFFWYNKYPKALNYEQIDMTNKNLETPIIQL